MRNYRIITLLFILLYSNISVVLGQNKVNLVSSDKETITLRVTTYASKVRKAIESAEVEAIKAVLFRGVPGSQQKTPLAGANEAAFYKKYPDYFQSFFNEKRYCSFVISSIPQTEFAKDITKKKCITMDIKVNLNALRIDLEQQSIIRKFGL